MKIHHYRPVDQYQYQQTQKIQHQKEKVQKTDEVEISAQAKQMQTQTSYAVEREAKLAELKKQIQAGTYEVNAKEIAKEMIDYYSKDNLKK